MASVETPTNADAGPSQPKPQVAQQPANITVLANRRFPVPPSYYTEFTPERWKRYTRSVLSGGNGTYKGKGKQRDDVEDQDVVMDTKPRVAARDTANSDDLAIFQPPRIDWIKREDSWNAFGRVYERRPKAMTAEQLGIPDFRPEGTEISDKQYMHLLLRSIIHTKLKLLEAYTKSVRPTYVLEQHFGIPHEGEHYVQHISNLAATMLTIANGLRETQARLTLELTIRRQIDRRREQTRLLRAQVHLKRYHGQLATHTVHLCPLSKCQELATRLTGLQAEVQSGSMGPAVLQGKQAEGVKAEMMDVS